MKTNELSGPKKLVFALAVIVTLGLVGRGAQAAWDAVAVHKKGQTQQNVSGSVNFTGAVRAGSFCALGADACLSGTALAPPPACGPSQHLTADGGGYICVDDLTLDDTLIPVNGSLLQYNADAGAFTPSQSQIVLTTGLGTADAGVGLLIENKSDLSSTQSAFQIREAVVNDAGTTRLFNVTGTGQVEVEGGQKICLDGATCTKGISYVTGSGYNELLGALLVPGNTQLQANLDARSAISNGGSGSGGSVAFNDPIRNLSTTTALFESSTAATGGTDYGFTFNTINTLDAADKLVVVQNNGNDKVTFFGDGAAVFLGNIQAAGGNGVVYAQQLGPTSPLSAVVRGNIGDGASAVGVVTDNGVSLTTAGAKLLSVRNNTAEKAFIDKDGRAYFAGGVSPDQIQSFGDAGYVWDDIRVPLSLTKPGATAPTWTEIMDSTGAGGTGGVAAWGFTSNQEESVYFSTQTPHGYANGMPIEAHIHWTMITTSTASPAVTWGLECSYGSREGSFKFDGAVGAREHAGTTATLYMMTEPANVFEVGQNIVVSGVSEAGCSAGAYNGNYRITAVNASAISYTSGAVSCTEASVGDTGTVAGYTIIREVTANVASNSQWKGFVSDFGTYRMRNCTGVSCVFNCRTYRKDVADLNETIPATEVDFHYPLNQIGSRQETVK